MFFDVSAPWILGLGLIPFAWFFYERGKALLQFFQQEEYSALRFLVWWGKERAVDRRATLLLLSGAIISLGGIAGSLYLDIGYVLYYLAPIAGALISRQTTKRAKKPLVMTARARRILFNFLTIALILLPIAVALSHVPPAETLYLRVAFYLVVMAVLVQILPLVLIVANWSLIPVENRIKRKYLNEAKRKLTVLRPYIIGITGSFGKTTSKHILSHILGSSVPTLATPGSVNTEMGITRIIRENLRPDHRYFIVEMGAYGPGSIARLCALTPPRMGILTAIGPAHYERFKTLKAVAKAKFELAEAVLRQKGSLILPDKGIPKDLRLQWMEKLEGMDTLEGNFRLVGDNGDFEIVSSDQSPMGTTIVIREFIKDEHGETDPNRYEDHAVRAPLYGDHQVTNIALCCGLARSLNMPWSTIKGALTTMPQIRHRLEVIRTPGYATIIDDAYNSNPIGFKAALELLDLLVEQGGRRILITPGMVELGARHDEDHLKVGRLAARHCDIAVVVTPERIPTFLEGLRANPDGPQIKTFARQQDAELFVKALWRAGDAVLFENNLPDLYEDKVKF